MTVTNEVGEIQGYVKLHRKLLDSRVFKHDGLCRTWIWCLLRATHKQRWVTISTGKGSTEVLLQPGQFIFGRESAARELGVPPSTIRNWIKKLKTLENLDIQQDRHYSIISIRNWHTYQAQDDEPGQPIGQQKDSQRTAKGHKQECKECKRIKPPPIGPPHEKPEDKTANQAKEVIAYLNQKTGRNYRDVSHITARLRDGATVEQCKHVIDVKMHDPFFRDNPKNLNPVTLFRPTHWDKYVNERVEDYQEEERRRSGSDAGAEPAYVPTPYELECLKVIKHEERTPEELAAADAARERAMAQLREMPWWKDSSK